MNKKLNPMGEWYRLIRLCDCGSEKPFECWHKDDLGNPLFKICEDCRKNKIEKYEEQKK